MRPRSKSSACVCEPALVIASNNPDPGCQTLSLPVTLACLIHSVSNCCEHFKNHQIRLTRSQEHYAHVSFLKIADYSYEEQKAAVNPQFTERRMHTDT